MFERFGRDARAAVRAASRDASEVRGDRHIGTEHLLIGVSEVGPDAMVGTGLSADDLRRALRELDRAALERVGIEVDVDVLPSPRRPRRRRHIPFTAGAKDCLHRGLAIALDLGHRRITADHLAASLALGGPTDPAVRLLRVVGVDPADLDRDAREALRRLAS